MRILWLLAVAALAPGCNCGSADDGVDAGPVESEFGLDERPSNTSCLAPERPPSGSSVTSRRAFPNLTFNLPIAMLQAPGDAGFWYMVTKSGVILRFANDEDTQTMAVTEFADISGIVNDGPNEAGLLGMAFHPDFASNGVVYLSYTRGNLISQVSEFTSNDGGETLDEGSEAQLFDIGQPAENHNGGHIAFGPDGHLYIGFGDGGLRDDTAFPGAGQNVDTALGSLLRIDVDGGSPYAIPPDNPFAGGGGEPEIYAWGLRNPWRFSFDTDSGELWLADVGQDQFEEVNLIVRGGNYGWVLKEAFDCYTVGDPCDDLDVIDPVAAYAHPEGESITGGFVYRGTAIPTLAGRYVYGDFVSGRVWGLFPGDDGLEDQVLFDSGTNISSFAQGIDGEVYYLSYGPTGTIHKLIPEDAIEDNFPKLLSATGCFDPADPSRPAAGLIPYDVNAALWSDGADKQRHLAIPDGQVIAVGDNGKLELPIGSVLVKTFATPEGRRLETRLLVRHDDGGWAGYSYEWNEAQTDAELLPAGKVIDLGATSWSIPSRTDCSACHTSAAGRTLGLELAQLNGEGVYPSTNRRANQVKTLAHIGLLEGITGDVDVEATPRLASYDDPAASAEDRARAYLHANCAHCHLEGGPGRSDADVRWHIDFAAANLCDADPIAGDLGVEGAVLLAPGEPERSLISLRPRSLEPTRRMPPLASAEVDAEGTEVIDDWIRSLAACP
jgi:uncharacterized repeat protein (TIGR03806 family)